jgi:hypothetical protein
MAVNGAIERLTLALTHFELVVTQLAKRFDEQGARQ